MKNFALIIVFKILFPTCIFSQNESYKQFINSFPDVRGVGIVNFGKVVQSGNNMSQKEAVDFVYHGDSTKLYCVEPSVDMETEQIIGESTELYLPAKCFKINFEQFYLIGYTSFECQNPIEISLTIMIVDKQYNIKDSMIVYRGNDFDYDITGLFNPINKKTVIVQKKMAYMYTINPRTSKFELLKNHNDKIDGQ
jgi:hypothetical protein